MSSASAIESPHQTLATVIIWGLKIAFKVAECICPTNKSLLLDDVC